MKIMLEPVTDFIFEMKNKKCYMYKHKNEHFLVPVDRVVFVENEESLIVNIEEVVENIH